AAYGEALAITREKPEVTPEENIIEPLREARAALTTYARILVTAVENEEVDPKVAAAALAPIADMRAQLRNTKKKDSKLVEDETETAKETVSPEPLPVVD